MPVGEPGQLRFVSAAEMQVEQASWGGALEWLCRPGLTDARLLQLVRVVLPPGAGHAFHRHPPFEEIIVVVSGEAEQWVGQSSRRLGPGDSAHIPRDEVHATYNAGDGTLVVLAILAPGAGDEPTTVDVSGEEPWVSLRRQPASSSVGQVPQTAASQTDS